MKSLDGIEAVVVGEPHRRFGEIAVLIYVGNQELDYKTLRRYLRQMLSRYEIPSKLVRVKDLPFTNSGKVARNTVQTLYLEERLKYERRVVIWAKRTPFGKYGGALRHLEPEALLLPLFKT